MDKLDKKTTEILFSRRNTAFGFKLIAKLGEKIVGTYSLPFDKSGDITHSVIDSEIPERSIPRRLINMAAKEISEISLKEKREVSHIEFLVNSDSIRLSHIFEELGYEKKEHTSYIVLSRTYFP